MRVIERLSYNCSKVEAQFSDIFREFIRLNASLVNWATRLVPSVFSPNFSVEKLMECWSIFPFNTCSLRGSSDFRQRPTRVEVLQPTQHS